jgi:lipopolysaccharide transport protein LptA
MRFYEFFLFAGGIVNNFSYIYSAKSQANWIRIFFWTFALFFVSSLVLADNQPKEKTNTQTGEQIQIVADKLVTNNEQKYAEFLGDVKTTHGNFVIQSERLRIYYKDDLARIKNQSSNQDLIKRIVASGNVRISSEKYVAEAAAAEYDLDTMVFVLSGENSTVKSGKNLITGSKITVDRKDGQIKVEGNAEKRVKAVFYSNEKVADDLPKTDSGDKEKQPDVNQPSQEPVENPSN